MIELIIYSKTKKKKKYCIYLPSLRWILQRQAHPLQAAAPVRRETKGPETETSVHPYTEFTFYEISQIWVDLWKIRTVQFFPVRISKYKGGLLHFE